MKNIVRLFLILVFIFMSMSPNIYADEPAGAVARPDWWQSADSYMAKMKSSSAQYFFIRDNYLKPAYKAQGAEKDMAFKRSIVALTKLLEWFPESQAVAFRCLAQFQIAWAYKHLGDKVRAKKEFEKCYDYKRFLNNPPSDRADSTIIAITRACDKEIARL